MPARSCRHCRRSFIVAAAQLRYEGYGAFCSRRCHYDFRRAQPHTDVVTPEGRVRVYAPESPMAGQSGYVYRYRLVMAAALGRPLRPDEHVDHLNGIPSDDRIENLAIRSASEHRMRHAIDSAKANGYDLLRERRCRSCFQVKPLSQFSPHSTRGRRVPSSQCKPCAAAWQRDYRRTTCQTAS